MNIAPVYLKALKALGYTEAESPLSLHCSDAFGLLLARQFLAFTDVHWGKRTTIFWDKLHTKRHARTECFPKSGTVYHLFSRPSLLPDRPRKHSQSPRNTKSTTSSGALECLDFVLLNQGYQYLKPSPKKSAFSAIN